MGLGRKLTPMPLVRLNNDCMTSGSAAGGAFWCQRQAAGSLREAPNPSTVWEAWAGLIDTVGSVAELPAANATGFFGWSSIVRSLVVSQTLTVWALTGATTAASRQTRVATIERAFVRE